MPELNLSHGAAYGDLDNDGDLDLVVNNMDEEAGVYRNNSNVLGGGKYLKIRLQGLNKNQYGIGSKVTAYAHGKLMMRELCPYRGFQSSVEPALYFGTNQLETFDSVVVNWPTGRRQTLSNVKTNQTLIVKEDASKSSDMTTPAPSIKMFSEDSLVHFVHHENDFIDFKYQSLLTRMYSSLGPAVASGDVNGDGLKDLYFGGAKGQVGELHIQNKKGGYTKKDIACFADAKNSEDIDAAFFDADRDGDLDLYVVTGGYEFTTEPALLEDKLYLNNGKGNFVAGKLPSMQSSGSCVRPCDFDHDGDLDLFVGGRIVPGRYPEAPESYLLQNNGKGNFSIATDTICPAIKNIGMVTDAAWTDLNSDGKDDLIVVGEWMPVKVFIYAKGMLTDKSADYFKEKTNGFWNTILVYDFDRDGDKDLIVGNQGLNTQAKPTVAQPATLYYSDFDENGSVDPLLFYYVKGEKCPFPTRDELTEQLPMLKKKFPKYPDYMNARLEDILSPEAIKKAAQLNAYTFATTYFRNDKGAFTINKLPIQLQFSPVFALAVMDVNNDGIDDLLTGGNLERTRARTGLQKGNNGFVFLGDAKGNFNFLSPSETGINIPSDVRKIIPAGDHVFFIINNDGVRSFKLNR